MKISDFKNGLVLSLLLTIVYCIDLGSYLLVANISGMFLGGVSHFLDIQGMVIPRTLSFILICLTGFLYLKSKNLLESVVYAMFCAFWLNGLLMIEIDSYAMLNSDKDIPSVTIMIILTIGLLLILDLLRFLIIKKRKAATNTV
jgi:hypothetical protein